MATTEERNTKELASAFSQRVENLAVNGLSSAAINKGAIVALNGSNQLVAANSTHSVILGRAEETAPVLADRPEVQKSIRVRSGIFLLDNDGTNPVAVGDRTCGLLDDETVDDGTVGTGVTLRVVEVNAEGVYVAIDPIGADIV